MEGKVGFKTHRVCVTCFKKKKKLVPFGFFRVSLFAFCFLVLNLCVKWIPAEFCVNHFPVYGNWQKSFISCHCQHEVLILQVFGSSCEVSCDNKSSDISTFNFNWRFDLPGTPHVIFTNGMYEFLLFLCGFVINVDLPVFLL